MTNINIESSSVQSYLSILQTVIGRMASNSAACKTWCIAIVSAVIVIIADKEKPGYVWISVVPISLLFLLDSYYLGLERKFRGVYNGFIKKLHSDTANIEDVFVIDPSVEVEATFLNTIRAFVSISVWPFYLILALMLIIVRIWIL